MKHAFAPLVDDDSLVLILGTLPGDESLRRRQYYADPSNQFWSLLAGVFGTPVGGSYAERLTFLAARRVALWDVLETAERVGSTDSAITNAKPNDFTHFFARFPELRRVAFNGSKAEALWDAHVRPRLGVTHKSLTTTRLPSSSSTPGRYVVPFDEKILRWQAFLRPAIPSSSPGPGRRVRRR